MKSFHDILVEAPENITKAIVIFSKPWPVGSYRQAANIFKGTGVKFLKAKDNAASFVFSKGMSVKDRSDFKSHMNKVFENVQTIVWD